MQSISRYLVAYAATAVVLVAIDLLWLGLIARPMYQRGIGHLMAERPNMGVAVVFYLVFSAGLLMFAVVPGGSWRQVLVAAALFGFFTYATYDLTNLATLKNWPMSLTVIDLSWGIFVSTIAAAAGKAAFDRLG